MKLHAARRVCVILIALALTAGALPPGKPEDVGLSSERLQRINQVVQRDIDAGQITGAITMVSRRGQVAHFEAQGQMDLEAKTPMQKDAIFRVASMSKPITGVAIAKATTVTVPAERDLTIRDLMTHTSGLESGGVGTRPGRPSISS